MFAQTNVQPNDNKVTLDNANTVKVTRKRRKSNATRASRTKKTATQTTPKLTTPLSTFSFDSKATPSTTYDLSSKATSITTSDLSTKATQTTTSILSSKATLAETSDIGSKTTLIEPSDLVTKVTETVEKTSPSVITTPVASKRTRKSKKTTPTTETTEETEGTYSTFTLPIYFRNSCYTFPDMSDDDGLFPRPDGKFWRRNTGWTVDLSNLPTRPPTTTENPIIVKERFMEEFVGNSTKAMYAKFYDWFYHVLTDDKQRLKRMEAYENLKITVDYELEERWTPFPIPEKHLKYFLYVDKLHRLLRMKKYYKRR